MRKIKVFARNLSDDEIKAAINLAAQAGCAPEEIDVVNAIGEPEPACDDELVLVVMTAAVCGDPDLEAELKKTPNGGRRAICVWPEGAEQGQQPTQPVANYAYSIIPWNPDKFSAVAADDDVMCFESPEGTALPKVKMEHNCCVEVEAKPT
jgi:hypothetical protein